MHYLFLIEKLTKSTWCRHLTGKSNFPHLSMEPKLHVLSQTVIGLSTVIFWLVSII